MTLHANKFQYIALCRMERALLGAKQTRLVSTLIGMLKIITISSVNLLSIATTPGKLLQ